MVFGSMVYMTLEVTKGNCERAESAINNDKHEH